MACHEAGEGSARLERNLLSREKSIYLLQGKSGTGKSAFLRGALRGRSALWLTSEQMKLMILEEARHGPIPIAGYDYIVVDNIEDISGKTTVAWFSGILDRWAEAGMTVVMTECRPRFYPLRTANPICVVDFPP